MANPLVQQGTLNRVRCSVIVPNFTSLNITSSFMGKSYASIHFEDGFADQIETGTGVVNSPAPYVMGVISVGVLKTLALANAWLEQVQATVILGHLTIHSDTAAFPAIHLRTAVIRDFDPKAFDGTDPVAQITLRGVYNINNDLWNL
ncbi:MAG: hypothetical protein ACYCS8_16745 [Acidithiobacillus sp.]